MNRPLRPSVVEECRDSQIRSETFFFELPDKSLQAFNQIKHPVSLQENSVIFREGQSALGVFLLCHGQVKLTTTSVAGNTFILRILKAGEVLGLHATVTGKPHEITAETMQLCQMAYVQRETFLPFLLEHPEACLQVAQRISNDYKYAWDVVRSTRHSHSISERLAKFLLESSADGHVANGVVRCKFVLTHEDIAQIIGTSRESITRTLSGFRKSEIVELKGSTLIVRNMVALGNLAAPC